MTAFKKGQKRQLFAMKRSFLPAALLALTVFSVCKVLRRPQPHSDPKVKNLGDRLANGIDDLTNSIAHGDLFALTHWDKTESELFDQIKREHESGIRDHYYIKKSYKARLENAHFNDVKLTDEFQKEVYLAALLLMRELVPQTQDGSGRKGLVADIGAGSGYKLMHYIAPEFDTIGFDTEPAISFLRDKYPDAEWVDSGEPEESLPSWKSGERKLDMCICSDVIEHIRDPDDLLKFLLSLKCSVYVISTPKRDALKKADSGPPINGHHVREWTFHEFQLYLTSQGFRVVRAFDGIQHDFTQFVVAVQS